MASYLQIENISKSYGEKILFENIGFNINEGDKIALIAPNGTGKTTLMRILAGKDKSDSGGQIKFLRQIRIAFLEQDPPYDPEATVFGQVCADSAEELAPLDEDGRFAWELRVRQLLTSFSLGDGSARMKDLSGGEVKRVALTRLLATEADFYIMDEPTNHLDTDAIEFLEGWFKKARCTLFMVTHDRYFLDRVCNTVMELDHGAIYIYRGDYENYLARREERIDNYNAQTEKVRNILRRELEWMHATPCARTGKAKYRKDAFYALQDRASQVYRSARLDMGDVGGASRLGSKVIDCKDVSFWYGDTCYLSHFTYNFLRYERVGIVGRNGIGKSTFVNLLTGADTGGGRMEGEIARGESLRIGYYHQDGIRFDEEQTVLETVSDTHLLSTFLFPHEMLSTRISKLSGGEKRRLYLLTILMQQPNLLILDEPTNDLDIVTLDVLEEYLLSFRGTLVIISHDRHFLDRLADHLFVFCGDGVVKDFIGGYTEYRSYLKDYEAEQRRLREEARKTAAPAPQPVRPARDSGKKKLSWKEQREFERLESEIETLNAEKAQIESLLSGGTLGYAECEQASRRFSDIKALLDEKETRWLELSL